MFVPCFLLYKIERTHLESESYKMLVREQRRTPWPKRQSLSSNCHWTSKLKFAKFDECFLKSCGVWVTHKLLSFFVFKAISAQKLSTQNGDFIFASFKLRVIFVHEVSLRSLTSLFD